MVLPNCVIHKGLKPYLVTTCGFIKKSIREANLLNKEVMRNSASELVLLRELGVEIWQPKALKIILVVWKLPAPYCIKININGATLGQLGLAGGGGVFCNSQSLLKVVLLFHLVIFLLLKLIC